MARPTDRSDLQVLRRHNRKLLRMCCLASEIARLGNERATLRKIVDTAASLIGVGAAHLALVDKREQTLYGVASSGRHAAKAPGLRVELSQAPAAQEALRTRRPVVIDRADGNPRVNARAREILSIGAVTYLPLLSGRQSFGLLILVTQKAHRWSAEELDLAKHFASFAAVAMENTRLLNRLAETEGRFRSLVEHIPAIVYICDVEPPYGSIYVSPQTETMLGYSCKEWTEDPNFFMKLVHPEDVKRLIDISDEAVRTTGFERSEYRVIDRRGEIRWFRDEAVLVRDPAGEPIAWHGVMVEITGMKKMQRATAGAPSDQDAMERHGPSPDMPRA